MLILAGAVLVISFLLAAFSVTELAAQEIALEQDPEGKLAATFFATRGEVASALSGLVIPETDNATLVGYFNAQRAEFEERGRAHGVFTILALAEGAAPVEDSIASQAEKRHMTDNGAASVCGGADDYKVWSYNGSRDYTDLDYDCGDDGILYDSANQRAKGIAIYLFMASEGARVEETFVIALN